MRRIRMFVDGKEVSFETLREAIAENQEEKCIKLGDNVTINISGKVTHVRGSTIQVSTLAPLPSY